MVHDKANAGTGRSVSMLFTWPPTLGLNEHDAPDRPSRVRNTRSNVLSCCTRYSA